MTNSETDIGEGVHTPAARAAARATGGQAGIAILWQRLLGHPQWRRWSGLALGAGGAILFSVKGVVMKFAFIDGGDVELMMALRLGLALPIYGLVALFTLRGGGRTFTGRDVMAAAGLGVLSYYVCTWLDFTGLKYISAQFERLILFLYPTFTAFFAWMLFGDKITKRHAFALAMSYAGVAVLFGRELEDFGGRTILGAGLVFTAAVLFAVYVTASKSVIGKLGSLLFTCIAMAAAAMAVFVHFGVETVLTGPTEMSWRLFVIGLVLAIGCTIAPSFMIAEAIARIGPGLASAVGAIGPVATAGVAVVALGEPFAGPHALAMILTVGGGLLLAAPSKH